MASSFVSSSKSSLMCLPSPFGPLPSARSPRSESRWTPCHDSRMALCIQPRFCRVNSACISLTSARLRQVALPGEFARDLDDARHERRLRAARRSPGAPSSRRRRRRMALMSRSMSMGTTTPAPLCVIPYLPNDVHGKARLPHRLAAVEGVARRLGFEHPLAERQRERGLRLLGVDHRALDRGEDVRGEIPPLDEEDPAAGRLHRVVHGDGERGDVAAVPVDRDQALEAVVGERVADLPEDLQEGRRREPACCPGTACGTRRASRSASARRAG